MTRNTLQILARVAKKGELPLDEAVRLGQKPNGDHRDQYALALLIQGNYVGTTINYTPPDGFEGMREFALAVTLHTFLLPRDSSGTVTYQGIRTVGLFEPNRERVFITAKGALYYHEHLEKRWDRLWSMGLGFATGLLAAVCSAWIKSHAGW